MLTTPCQRFVLAGTEPHVEKRKGLLVNIVPV